MQWDSNISFPAWHTGSADKFLRDPGTLSISVRKYPLTLEQHDSNTAMLKLASTTVKVRATLRADGFLSSRLRHLSSVCAVVRRWWSIICFPSRRDSTDTQDLWSSEFFPTYPILFFLLLEYKPCLLGRQTFFLSVQASFHYSCLSHFLKILPPPLY